MSIWSTLSSIAGAVLPAIPGIGTVGSIVGAGLGALGSGLAQDESNANYLQGVQDTNAANKAIADANNAESWRRLQATNQFTKEMWQENNAYNSPAAQLMRLRQAGLNPAAFTGESPAAQISSQAPPGMSTPIMQAPGQTPVVDYGHLASDRLMANEMVRQKQLENSTSALNLTFLTQEKKNELLKQAAEIQLTKNKSVESAWAARKASQEYEQFARLADSLAKGAALQVDSLEQNMRIQNEQNVRAWNQDRREAAKLRIEQMLADDNIKLNSANRAHIYNMIDLANNADLRADQAWTQDKFLKDLDYNLRRLQIDETSKQNVFNEIMRQTDLYHESLKDASLLNRFSERAFGLGFRDVGAALKALIK